MERWQQTKEKSRKRTFIAVRTVARTVGSASTLLLFRDQRRIGTIDFYCGTHSNNVAQQTKDISIFLEYW